MVTSSTPLGPLEVYRSLTSEPHGISRGMHKLAQTTTVIIIIIVILAALFFNVFISFCSFYSSSSLHH